MIRRDTFKILVFDYLSVSVKYKKPKQQGSKLNQMQVAFPWHIQKHCIIC